MWLSRKTRLLLLLKRRQEKNSKKKRMWVRKLFQERKQKGEFHLLIRDMCLYDEEYFFKYFRMNSTQLELLLSKVAPLIQKSSKLRECIGPPERLCVTMKYLTTGDAQSTIAKTFRMSPSVVGRIIEETCSAIWETLSME